MKRTRTLYTPVVIGGVLGGLASGCAGEAPPEVGHAVVNVQAGALSAADITRVEIIITGFGIAGSVAAQERLVRANFTPDNAAVETAARHPTFRNLNSRTLPSFGFNQFCVYPGK